MNYVGFSHHEHLQLKSMHSSSFNIAPLNKYIDGTYLNGKWKLYLRGLRGFSQNIKYIVKKSNSN